MKLWIRTLMLTVALFWGGCILCAGLGHLAFPGYVTTFLSGVSSIDPGFHRARGFADMIIGTPCALVDGAPGG
jgi:hypothetical protein